MQYESSFNAAKEMLAWGAIGELRSFGLEFYHFVAKGLPTRSTLLWTRADDAASRISVLRDALA